MILKEQASHFRPYSMLQKNIQQQGNLFIIAIFVGSILFGILYALWIVQQHNVNLIQQGIDDFQSKLSKIVSNESLELLKLEKDILILKKDKTTIQNGVYATLVQAIGGLILGMTAYVGYRNFRISEDKQITKHFSKAIEHLGDEKIDIRLGGIYVLAQIAIDSPKYHWTIIEILSAFIREKSTIHKPDLDGNIIPQQKLTTDVKAAITALGRRNIDRDNGRQIDLRNVYLAEIEIESDANLCRVNLSGSDLYAAKLNGIDLSEAKLYKANLNRANLSSANLTSTNLTGAQLCKANLSSANLNKADLISANLMDANLSSTYLSSANLRSANLCNTNLSGAYLYSANLSRTKNSTSTQIKSACYWDRAIYTAGKLEELKHDRASNPQQKPDCSRW
jgi:uncharacterized protein YjbI with pentapeptide repeats